MDDLVLVERRTDGVVVVTLNNPKVNALKSALLDRLHDVARALTDDPPGAVVITGGARIFAAGADIGEFSDEVAAARIGASFHRALNAVAAIPRFVIAAVNGFALGGGCELALACDYRVAGEKAVFGQPEVLLGIIPGGGGTQRLPRVVGASRAKEMMITGRQVPSDEALRIGLADEVVPNERVLDRALELAAEVARGAVLAQGIIKRVVDQGLSTSLDEGLRGELDGFVEVFTTDDSRVGVNSFRENGPGKATFSGR